MTLAVIAAVIIGTWSGNWFPSGRSEHRAHPDVEMAVTSAAAKMIDGGIRSIDPNGTNDLILCFNEIRGPIEASNLVSRINRKDLKVAVVSRYRRRDRFDMQQNVIATTLPVINAGWNKWETRDGIMPPRGYAYATIVISPAVTANVCAVHLKSNYGATTEERREDNRNKRTVAITELLEREHGKHTIIAGDMNADKWRSEFEEETIFGMLAAAGFVDALERLPTGSRGTHPSRTYGNSTLDYIFCRGFCLIGMPKIVSSERLSDHDAVFAVIDSDL